MFLSGGGALLLSTNANIVIGNNVMFGPNAVIVGKIVIGDDVLIVGNSFVNFDVPAHSIVIGNPGKIIRKENATFGYICQKYEIKKGKK